jgi:hypothetical protein
MHKVKPEAKQKPLSLSLIVVIATLTFYVAAFSLDSFINGQAHLGAIFALPAGLAPFFVYTCIGIHRETSPAPTYSKEFLQWLHGGYPCTVCGVEGLSLEKPKPQVINKARKPTYKYALMQKQIATYNHINKYCRCEWHDIRQTK